MRNRRLLLVLGALAVGSAVVAGFVIFGDTPDAAPKGEGAPALALTSGSLRVGGAPGASYDVVVTEDFGSTAARDFELASRDFLRIEGARGDVRVEYRLVDASPGTYGATALAAYDEVVGSGTPKQVLALHDRLFDRQPPGLGGALPTVSVNGTPVAAASGTALADALQSTIVKGER